MCCWAGSDDVPPIDVVLCIVDASNLERNLYLVSQVLELGLPTVVALNMVDVAEDKGLTLDLRTAAQSSCRVPVVPVQANRGSRPRRARSRRWPTRPTTQPPHVASPFPEAFQQRSRSAAIAGCEWPGQPLPRYLVERLLLDTSGYLAKRGLPGDRRRLLTEAAGGPRRGWPRPGCRCRRSRRWPAIDWAARGAGRRRRAARPSGRVTLERPDRPRADAPRLGHAGLRRW